mgnify:CR=1 FL=1
MDNKNKNINALTIGFVLIFIIAAFTVLRSLPKEFKEEKAKVDFENEKQENSEQIEEKNLISSEELYKRIKNMEKFKIIDIRSAEEYKLEHIADSYNIPISNLSSFVKDLKTSDSIVIVDLEGLEQNGITAINILKGLGFENVYFLSGGLVNWKLNFNPTISEGEIDSFSDRAKVRYITSDELKNIMDSERNIFVIDVRNQASFAEGHLKNAINIPLSELENRRKEIPVGKKIIVTDNDGFDSFKAAVKLFDLGFINTFILSDGLVTWKNKNYEIIK